MNYVERCLGFPMTSFFYNVFRVSFSFISYGIFKYKNLKCLRLTELSKVRYK